MCSLNGDTMVMRNGRSTSQVSVYNYPEHLNPFYEDDQHKRLRFWKINKKDNEGRRNSFSISNLKDILVFKSFRMKKKSSTLGINKTSESPPILRRDYVLDNGWNTFDNRLRASNTSSIDGDSFQRNATYRSSLQTLPTAHDRMGLNRNDGYRSTIQVARSFPRYQPQQKLHQSNLAASQNRRYVYGGSVTPQPLRNSRSNIGRGPYEYDIDNAMIRGSSQSSMVSSNPFESDDDENEDLKTGMRSVMNGSTTTLTSRTPRKKRRAPAPPTPIHGRSNGRPLPTIRIESSQDNSQDELHIDEEIDIANLTAEIESFVKTKSIADAEETKKEVNKTTLNSDSKDNLQDSSLKGEKQSPNAISITSEDIKILPKEIVNTTEKVTVSSAANTNVEAATKLTFVSNEIETKDIKTNGAIPKKPNNNCVANDKSMELQQDLCIKENCVEEMAQKPTPLKRQTKPETEVVQVECIHVHVESPKASPRQDHSNGLTSFKATEYAESEDSITTKTPFVLTSPPTQKKKQPQNERVEPLKKETVKIVETNTKRHLTNELTIQEELIHTKPEILVKPVLSPKPVTNQPNGMMPAYAGIHKPMRRHNQNGHIIKSARDGSVSPPFVPQEKTTNEEEKINNTNQLHNNNKNMVVENSLDIKNLDNLKIVETNAITIKCNGDLKEEENKKQQEVIANNSVSLSTEHQEHQKEPRIDDEFDLLYRPKPTNHMEWKRSTLAPLETNIPPEKRKSVKDIIESINRSQRLLNAAANKDFPMLQNQNTTVNNTVSWATTHKCALNNNNLNADLKISNDQCEEYQEQPGAANSPSPSPSNDNNDNNNEIFQKCKVNKEVFDYRETSPITSNLDWNPVPKPKRTKAAQE